MAILPPQKEPTTSVTFRVPDSLYAELEAVAAEEGYDRTGLYLHLIRTGLAEYRREAAEMAAAKKKERR